MDVNKNRKCSSRDSRWKGLWKLSGRSNALCVFCVVGGKLGGIAEEAPWNIRALPCLALPCPALPCTIITSYEYLTDPVYPERDQNLGVVSG